MLLQCYNEKISLLKIKKTPKEIGKVFRSITALRRIISGSDGKDNFPVLTGRVMVIVSQWYNISKRFLIFFQFHLPLGFVFFMKSFSSRSVMEVRAMLDLGIGCGMLALSWSARSASLLQPVGLKMSKMMGALTSTCLTSSLDGRSYLPAWPLWLQAAATLLGSDRNPFKCVFDVVIIKII